MRLIWTYDYGVFVDELANRNKIILLNLYTMSIQSAKRLGYHTIMYCTKNSISYFEGLADELHIVENKLNTPLYDYIKFQVLAEQEDDDYYLIDGDLILNFPLPIPTSDITFDAYENHFTDTGYFSEDYEEVVNGLTDLGLSNVIIEWNNPKMFVINCGILNIKGKENRKLYIDRWQSYNSFVMNNISKLPIKNLTNIGAQYLLTLIRDYHNWSYTKMEYGFGRKGYYYTHYAGDGKYTNPIVPSNYITPNTKQKELI